MLSESFDMNEFIGSVKGRPFEEVILMSDREATEAERHIYRNCRPAECEDARRYAFFLKDFIIFMRHGVLTRSMHGFDLSAFLIS